MTEQHFNDNTPDALDRAIESRLDALGETDRTAAPAGLEASIMARVAETIAPSPIVLERPAVWWTRTPMRIAAGLVITGAVGVVAVVSQQNQQPQPGPVADAGVQVDALEAQIETLYALQSVSNDGFDDTLASLELWADTVGIESERGWASLSTSDDWFGEGAL